MLDRNAWIEIRIMSDAKTGVSNRYRESCCDSKTAVIYPARDRATTVFVIVRTTEAASCGWFFPRFSEVNLVRAVGKARSVMRIKVVERKVRIDKAPMSASVRAFVFVTMM